MRTRIKICGITNPQDAQTVVTAGADAIGLVFYPPSPRSITIQQAQAIVTNLPPFITVVGLFVNAEYRKISKILETVRIDLLQFHGNESPQECMLYQRPWIKAISMRDNVNLQQSCIDYKQSAALLLDTYQPKISGGTGKIFDWTRIPPNLSKPIIVAGGLTPEIVAQAIQQVQPYAVDVSGGVEKAKGIKDADKIMDFVSEVRHIDQNKP